MKSPRWIAKNITQIAKGSTNIARGFMFGKNFENSGEVDKLTDSPDVPVTTNPPNPLEKYFDSHTEGRGIWKWRHYFEIYHRHLSKFIGRKVNVLEIGIYSGGSLDMWKDYFGPACHVYGVDIEEACKSYEDDSTTVFIGDQADRHFWKRFKKEVPSVDVLIDDGGHQPHQQIVTLEEMLPHINPGGVFICEDVHGAYNPFHAYVAGLFANLNSRLSESRPNSFQRAVSSAHLYSFMTVIEKRQVPLSEISAPKHGTEWQPFL